MKAIPRFNSREISPVWFQNKKTAACALAVAFIVNAYPFAVLHADDESDRGRLADGRAFRTDAEGNQLVDYIAELEVNAEALKTQVSGLESELREKQATIDRMRASGALDCPVSEKTLSGEGRAVGASGRDAQSDMTRQQAASVVSASVPQPSCSEDTQKIAVLTGELESTQADLQVERQLSAKRMKEAQEMQENLQKELAERSALLASLSTELGEARTLNARLNEEISKSRMRIVSAERRPATIVQHTADLTSSMPERAEVRAALAAPSTRPEVVQGSASGGLSEARLRAVEVVRGKVRTDLNQLRGLVASRDQAYQRYGKGSQRISFKPQPARTDQGASIKDLEQKLAGATSVSEAAKIGREISQIRARMNEDIALMKRTMR